MWIATTLRLELRAVQVGLHRWHGWAKSRSLLCQHRDKGLLEILGLIQLLTQSGWGCQVGSYWFLLLPCKPCWTILKMALQNFMVRVVSLSPVVYCIFSRKACWHKGLLDFQMCSLQYRFVPSQWRLWLKFVCVLRCTKHIFIANLNCTWTA